MHQVVSAIVTIGLIGGLSGISCSGLPVLNGPDAGSNTAGNGLSGSTGTGGDTGTGGNKAGNAAGTNMGGAGTSSTGGAFGTGGMASAGGSANSGGTASSGGAMGSGGTKLTAGSTGSGGRKSTGGSTGSGGTKLTGGSPGSGGTRLTGGSTGTGGAKLAGGSTGTGGAAGGPTTPTTLPEGWLYTSGNKIYVSHGASQGTVWMGRGANMDDLMMCGYNNSLWDSGAATKLKNIASVLIEDWKATFIRVSLSMNSGYEVVSWLDNFSQYRDPMTDVIKDMGAHSDVYVLVTLRSDTTMTETDSGNEATFVPQTGTDAVYKALVNSFANDKFVMFGVSNEPGTISATKLVPIMDHAVSVIRAEEDRLGVPHHLVAVQGRMWTSDVSFYADKPLPYDNVVYEVHGYSPLPEEYTFSKIPVIIGEYGDGQSGNIDSAFFADMEAKQIPNLAWDFSPYSNCAPDLLQVNQSDTNLVPSEWGTRVKNYLASH